MASNNGCIPIAQALEMAADGPNLKQIKCIYCDHAFYAEGVRALLSHILTLHLAERADNIECSSCQRTFSIEGIADVHVRAHRQKGVDATWSRMVPNWKNTELLEKGLKLVDLALANQFASMEPQIASDQRDATPSPEISPTPSSDESPPLPAVDLVNLDSDASEYDQRDEYLEENELQADSDEEIECVGELTSDDPESVAFAKKREEEERQRKEDRHVKRIPHTCDGERPEDPRDYLLLRLIGLGPPPIQVSNPPFAKGWKYIGNGEWRIPHTPPSTPTRDGSPARKEEPHSSTSGPASPFGSPLGKRKFLEAVRAIEARCPKKRAPLLENPPAALLARAPSPRLLLTPHLGPDLPTAPAVHHTYAGFVNAPLPQVPRPTHVNEFGFRVYADQPPTNYVCPTPAPSPSEESTRPVLPSVPMPSMCPPPPPPPVRVSPTGTLPSMPSLPSREEQNGDEAND